MLERPVSKAGWTRVRFDQIATQINDRVDNPAEAGVDRYVGLEHLDPDSLRIRRWGEPTDVESTKLRFQPGDIIFGKRRVYQRKVAVADFEGICSAHAMVLRAKPDALLPEFLPFFMQTDLFMERALSISVGSLSPTINWKALAAEEFLLPPIQEQARLAETFSAIDNLIEASILAEAKAIDVLQALYAKCFLSATSTISLGKACSFITSGSRGWAAHYSDEGDVFFRITNMRRKSINPDWTDVKYVQAPDTMEAARTLVHSGDVLISITADIGLATLVREDFPKSYVNQHVAILRPIVSTIVPDFLAHYLVSDFGYRQLNKFNDQGAKAGLNLQNLSDIIVPHYSIAEQNDFVSAAASIVGGLVQLQEKLAKERNLRSKLINVMAAEALA